MATFIQGSGTVSQDSLYKIPIVVASNVGMVDLGTLNWTYRSATNNFYAAPNTPSDAKNISQVISTYCSEYTAIANVASWSSTTGTDKSVLFKSGSTDLYLVINDSSYTDGTALKSSLSGVYLFYQRSTDTSWTTPTITNIYLDEPLRKLGNYADYVDFANSKVYRYITSLIGSDFTQYTSNHGYTSYYKYLSDTAVIGGEGTNILISNSYGNVSKNFESSNLKSTDSQYSTTYGSGARIYAILPASMDKSAYYVFCVSTTPTEETITLPTLATTKGTNYIQVATDVAPSSVSVVYRSRVK